MTKKHRARAVIYLRVSTSSQVNTDYDPEGISLPAQRSSCSQRARQDDLEVIGEYVEPGESGRGAAKRPAFQAMLERIRNERDVDAVIVYKLSRLHRNRLEDAMTVMELRECGVQLISATEAIDDTPVGQLMHGILASINEYRSAEDGADIRDKMAYKAKNGGTVSRAPLGYLNVRERFEGREVRTVAVDPERGPLVTEAFQLYGTGEFTLGDLSEELADRGLLSRPGRYPSRPLSNSSLGNLLRNRYYLGYVAHKGEEFRGRHESLIDLELFDRVQGVLSDKSKPGTRRRLYNHYLKGTVWCGPCHARDDDNRLIRARAKGNGGIYDYFLCRGRQKGTCELPHLSMRQVEEEVAAYYRSIELRPSVSDRIRSILAETLGDSKATVRRERAQLKTQIDRISVAEENLLDLAADGMLATVKVRQRLHDLQDKRERIDKKLTRVHADLGAAAAVLDSAVQLLVDPEALYRSVLDDDRRSLNEAIFERLYVHEGSVGDSVLRSPFAELAAVSKDLDADESAWNEKSLHHTNARHEANSINNEAVLLARAIQEGHGSSKTAMVDHTRLELVTSRV